MFAAALICATIASSAHGQTVATYGYDAQGQVVSVARGGASVTYGYDQAGNRILVTASGGASQASASMTSAALSEDSIQAATSSEEASPEAVTYPAPFTPRTPVLGPVQPAGLTAPAVNGVVVAPAPTAAPRDPRQ